MAAQTAQSPEAQIKVVNKAATKIKNKDALRAANAQQPSAVRFIVEFESAPVATYRGGVVGLAATSAKATGADRLDSNSNEARAYAN